MSWLKVNLETSIHYSHFLSSLKNCEWIFAEGERDQEQPNPLMHPYC